jgi:hypothetical protein
MTHSLCTIAGYDEWVVSNFAHKEFLDAGDNHIRKDSIAFLIKYVCAHLHSVRGTLECTFWRIVFLFFLGTSGSAAEVAESQLALTLSLLAEIVTESNQSFNSSSKSRGDLLHSLATSRSRVIHIAFEDITDSGKSKRKRQQLSYQSGVRNGGASRKATCDTISRTVCCLD